MSNVPAIQTFGNSELGEIRIADHEGNPWFVLRDILDAMGTTTPTTVAVESIEKGLGDGFNKVIPIVDSLGREQKAIIVSEPAATFLLSRSNTEQGRRLNRWIHAEVLPAIRKTGKYEMPKSKLKVRHPTMKRLRSDFDEAVLLAERIGIVGNQALFAADHAVKQLNNFSPLGLLGVTHLIPQKQERHLTPSDIGAVIGMTARQVNQLLVDQGFQEPRRDAKKRLLYVPTEKGMPYAILLDTQKKNSEGVPVTQLKWLEPIIDALFYDEIEKAA